MSPNKISFIHFLPFYKDLSYVSVEKFDTRISVGRSSLEETQTREGNLGRKWLFFISFFFLSWTKQPGWEAQNTKKREKIRRQPQRTYTISVIVRTSRLSVTGISDFFSIHHPLTTYINKALWILHHPILRLSNFASNKMRLNSILRLLFCVYNLFCV